MDREERRNRFQNNDNFPERVFMRFDYSHPYRDEGSRNFRGRSRNPRQNNRFPGYRPRFQGPRRGGRMGARDESSIPEILYQSVHQYDDEQKAKEGIARELAETVWNLRGNLGRLIFLRSSNQPNACPVAVMQSAVDNAGMTLTLEGDSSSEFILKINNEVVASGKHPNKQAAKRALCNEAIQKLEQYCFTIIKKEEFEDVDTRQEKTEEPTSSGMQGSVAHKMMLKMGWGGKGLGVDEQGEQKTVAEKLSSNISREGLGSGNIMEKVKGILEDFAKSDKLAILRFEPDFTSKEREAIHTIAKRFNLKSKSIGKEPNRRLTVTKNINRCELVIELLAKNKESEAYRLVTPTKFTHMFVDEDQDSS